LNAKGEALRLSPEQVTAIDLFLANETFACFDPPGAGKTAVAINAIVSHGEFPALVTMPAHLVPQWKLQLELWGVPAEEIAAAPRGCGPTTRMDALTGNCAIALVSYNSWSDPKYRPLLLHRRWCSYTFDESHRLRRGKGATWHSVKKLREVSNSKHVHTPVWWLSGTPLVKDASDIWPFLFMVNKHRWGNHQKFILNTCVTFQGKYKLEIGAVRDPDAFHRLLGQYSIRRSWRQIPSLAKLQRRDVDLPIELDPATLNRHRVIKRDYTDPVTGEKLGSSAEMVHALRRISVATKVESVTEFVLDHPGRLLLLAWYRDSARSMANAITRVNKVPVAYIDGGTSEAKRAAAIRLYKANKDCVLVGTIGSMKEGWDSLQIGYQALFVEQSFVSVDNDQALHRLLRRGQKRPVMIYWMYALRTFDIRVRKLASTKQDNIEQALGEFLHEEEWRA
jgi:hypothetical protein